MSPAKTFNVGDRVRYTGEFLRQIGAYTGNIPQMRGIVRSTKTYPGVPFTIARVQWDGENEELSVNTHNLERCK